MKSLLKISSSHILSCETAYIPSTNTAADGIIADVGDNNDNVAVHAVDANTTYRHANDNNDDDEIKQFVKNSGDDIDRDKDFIQATTDNNE